MNNNKKPKCKLEIMYDVILIIINNKYPNRMERLHNLSLALTSEPIKVMEGEFLKITDNRTGKNYEISVK